MQSKFELSPSIFEWIVVAYVVSLATEELRQVIHLCIKINNVIKVTGLVKVFAVCCLLFFSLIHYLIKIIVYGECLHFDP